MDNTCQVFKCGRSVYQGENKCIFHCEEKDVNDFTLALEKFVEEQQRWSWIDYSRFIFPEDFSHYNIIKDNLNKETSFAHAIFKGIAHFKEAVFNVDVNFYQTRFEKEVYFSKVKFHKAFFNGVVCKETAIFFETSFAKEADFSKAEFHGDVDFGNASFDKVNFSRAEFIKRADFSGAKFPIIGQFNELFMDKQALIAIKA